MVDPGEEPARARLRLRGQPFHREDRRDADPPLLPFVEELVDLPAGDPLLQEDAQGVRVVESVLHAVEELEGRPLGVPHQLDEPLPLVLFGRDDEDETVAARIDAPGIEPAGAEAAGEHTGIGPVDERRLDERRHVGLLGQVHVLALAGALGAVEGGERSRAGRHAGLEVRLVAEGLERRQVGMLGGAGAHPRPAAPVRQGDLLGAVVAMGSGETEGRDRAEHEGGTEGTQPLVVDAERVHAAGRQVVDQDVGTGHQGVETSAVARLLEIEHDRTLVDVEREEETAPLRIRPVRVRREGAALARRVAAGRLDLDHVRAEIGHHPGGEGRRHEPAQLQNTHAVEPLQGRPPRAMARHDSTGCWVTLAARMSAPSIVTDPRQVDAAWLTAVLHHAGVGSGTRVKATRSQGVGTGQMGRNVRFALDWEGGPQDELPASVVGKFPSDDPTSRATGASQGAYEKEVRFYRELRHTVGIRTPRCFFADVEPATGDFVMVMEDLAPALQGDQLAGCSVDQAALALAEAARLHAPRWGDPTLEDLGFLVRPGPESAEGLQAIYKMLWPGFAERYGDTLDAEALGLSQRLGDRLAAWVLEGTTPLTLVHGDYRLDNMLFGTSEGGYPLAVVDWQTVGLGRALADAAYFMGASLLEVDRRAHEQALLRDYHERLQAGGVRDYSFDQCFHDYRRNTFGGVVMAVVASMIVEQTARGDEMFLAMASRHAAHALDLESEALLR